MTFWHPAGPDDRRRPPDGPHLEGGAARWQRWAAWARRAWADQRELHERLLILNRPWTHDQLHWAPTRDGGAELHGMVAPPPRSPGPVTSGGWCPCVAAARRRARYDELLATQEP